MAAWLLVLVSLVLTESSRLVSGVAGVAAGVLLLAAAGAGLAREGRVETARQRQAATGLIVVMGLLGVAWGLANLV